MKMKLFFSFIAIIAPLIMIIQIVVIPYYNYKQAFKEWKKIPASVVKRESIFSPTEEGPSYNDVVSYKYSVLGKEFISSKYSFGKSPSYLSNRIYYPGASISCFYDPQNPSDAVIIMEKPSLEVMTLIICFFIFAAGLWLLRTTIFPYPDRDSANFRQKDICQHSGNISHECNGEKNLALTQVSSTPTMPNSGNYLTLCRFVQVTPTRVEFRPQIKKIFVSLVLPIVLITCGVWFIAYSYQFNFSGYFLLIVFLFGIVILLPLKMYLLYRRIPVFDLDEQCFRMGQRDTGSKNSISVSNVPIRDICAIQLLQKTVLYGNDSSSAAPTTSYEINLVLQDGRRIWIMDGGSIVCIRNDAQQLADFLHITILDQI